MEATELFEIYQHEDDSVRKKLTKKAIKLQKQYYKRRKINERFIKQKSLAQKITSLIFDAVLIVVALACGLICFCNVSSRLQNLPPSIGGYMTMQIVSGSMRASGFEIGDSVMIQAVETDTLKEGDMIAFYVYAPSYRNFSKYKSEKLNLENTGELQYNVSIKSFLGLQNEEVQIAAKANSRRVFHEIIGVYEDKEGVRWFETKGTSNASKDRWWVKETLVIEQTSVKASFDLPTVNKYDATVEWTCSLSDFAPVLQCSAWSSGERGRCRSGSWCFAPGSGTG